MITAEVKVDETDIVNVKLDQEADITIDAIPNKTFKGKVIEIGNTAISVDRAGGLAECYFQSGSERLQSGRSPKRSARRDPARPVVHRQGDYRHPPEGSDDSHPGVDSPAEG